MTCTRCGRELPAQYTERGLCPKCRCHICNADLTPGEEFICSECERHFLALGTVTLERMAWNLGDSE